MRLEIWERKKLLVAYLMSCLETRPCKNVKIDELGRGISFDQCWVGIDYIISLKKAEK